MSSEEQKKIKVTDQELERIKISVNDISDSPGSDTKAVDLGSIKITEKSVTTTRPLGLSKYLVTTIPILVVLGIGAIIWSMQSGPPENEGQGEGMESSIPLLPNINYYICVTLLEVAPRRIGSRNWDGDGSAPDLRYEVHWKNNKIFSSNTRKNSLIGSWSPIAPDIWDTIRSGELSVTSTIKSATIRTEPGGEFLVVVYDVDFLEDERIGAVTISPLDHLVEGVKKFTMDSGDILRMQIRAIREDLSDAQIIKQLTTE